MVVEEVKVFEEELHQQQLNLPAALRLVQLQRGEARRTAVHSLTLTVGRIEEAGEERKVARNLRHRSATTSRATTNRQLKKIASPPMDPARSARRTVDVGLRKTSGKSTYYSRFSP